MAMSPLAIVAWAAIAVAILASLPVATAHSGVAKTSGMELAGQGVNLRHLLSEHDDDDDSNGIYVDDKYIVIHNVTTGYVHHYNDTYDCYSIDGSYYDFSDDDDDSGYGDAEHDDDDGYGGGEHDDDGFGGDDKRKLMKHHKIYILIAKCPEDYVSSKDGLHVVFYKSADGAIYYEKDDGVGDDDDDGVFDDDDDGIFDDDDDGVGDDDDDGVGGDDDDGVGGDDDGVSGNDDDDDDDGKGHIAGAKPKKVYSKGDDDDGSTKVSSPKKVYAKGGDDDGYGGGDDKRRRMLGSRAMLSLK